MKRRYELDAGDLVAKLKRSKDIDENEDKAHSSELELDLNNVPLSQPWTENVTNTTRTTSVKPKNNNNNGKAEKAGKLK